MIYLDFEITKDEDDLVTVKSLTEFPDFQYIYRSNAKNWEKLAISTVDKLVETGAFEKIQLDIATRESSSVDQI